MKRVSLNGWVCPEQEGLARSNPSSRKKCKGPFGPSTKLRMVSLPKHKLRTEKRERGGRRETQRCRLALLLSLGRLGILSPARGGIEGVFTSSPRPEGCRVNGCPLHRLLQERFWFPCPDLSSFRGLIDGVDGGQTCAESYSFTPPVVYPYFSPLLRDWSPYDAKLMTHSTMKVIHIRITAEDAGKPHVRGSYIIGATC